MIIAANHGLVACEWRYLELQLVTQIFVSVERATVDDEQIIDVDFVEQEKQDHPVDRKGQSSPNPHYHCPVEPHQTMAVQGS